MLRKSPQMTERIVVRFEVLMTVTMKNGVFWDVTPCGSCKNLLGCYAVWLL
jgi:hypothetical protein